MLKLLVLSAMLGAEAAPCTPAVSNDVMATPLGGPPRIMLAGKSNGDITAAQWSSIKAVDLHGCVPDARIVTLSICIKDCTSKTAFASGADATITSAMRTMIANLPAGTPFTVKVTVKDAKGKAWEVPDATYTWRK